MNYYAHLDKRDNTISKSQCLCLSDFIENIEITKEVYDNFERYIYSDGEIVENPDYWMIELEQAKAERVVENDTLRDEKLNAGVEYNNVLFDSDTDQKINLLATVSMMSDEDTIVWYGMDNQGLLCTKSDLVAIGQLITELHSYCWQQNAYIKEQIEQADSLAKLDEIIISY